MKKFFAIVVVILVLGFLASLPNLTPNPSPGQERGEGVRYVELAGQRVKVELAMTPEAQAQGLSARQDLAEGTGMLFVFDVPSRQGFWMQDMNFPIDIIWIAGDMKVVYIKKDARPESYPEVFTPPADAKYVLEVPAGFAERYGLQVGDVVKFSS